MLLYLLVVRKQNQTRDVPCPSSFQLLPHVNHSLSDLTQSLLLPGLEARSPGHGTVSLTSSEVVVSGSEESRLAVSSHNR